MAQALPSAWWPGAVCPSLSRTPPRHAAGLQRTDVCSHTSAPPSHTVCLSQSQGRLTSTGSTRSVGGKESNWTVCIYYIRKTWSGTASGQWGVKNNHDTLRARDRFNTPNSHSSDGDLTYWIYIIYNIIQIYSPTTKMILLSLILSVSKEQQSKIYIPNVSVIFNFKIDR